MNFMTGLEVTVIQFGGWQKSGFFQGLSLFNIFEGSVTDGDTLYIFQ